MRVLFIIAQQGFQDIEFGVPYQILMDSGASCDVASIETGKAVGKYGREFNVELAVKDAIIEQYDALILIGGPGAPELKDHQEVLDIVKKAKELDKIIASICIAGTILAAADVIQGKRATVWNKDGKQDKVMEAAGATYVPHPVVVDGRLITADGPKAAEEFGKVILRHLSG